MNEASMSHVRRLAPILSPMRPRDVPRRKASREVNACWSAFWKPYVRSPIGANVRATARPSWATFPLREKSGNSTNGRYWCVRGTHVWNPHHT
jgi:hypothetical protein